MKKKDKQEEYQEEYTWRHEREAIIESLLDCRTEKEYINLLINLVEMFTEGLDEE